MFNEFLSELGKRLCSENDLSDVTWALLQSSRDFRNVFLSFIGINDTDIESAFEFEREYSLPGNLRVDLAILFPFGESAVFLENKIWDKNYHFTDYSKAVDPSDSFKLVLLSAHQIDPPDSILAKKAGWSLRYWNDFYGRLCSLTFKESDDVRIGFINYLRRVCMIRPVGKIHFDSESLHSLYSFNNLIRRIVQNASNDKFTYALYTQGSRSYSEGYSACYYSVAVEGNDHPFAYPAVGIDYEENPGICVWLDRDWNGKIADAILKVTPKKTDWFEIENETDYVIFWMLQELFDKFNAMEKTQQAGLLQDFFRNVNVFIEKTNELQFKGV